MIVGQTYLIPAGASGGTAAQQVQAQPQPEQQPQQPALQTPAGEAIASVTDYFYTVRENDSLWKIANEQLGNPGAIAAIKELNQLKSDTITPGMKLRLPGKPIAQATN